MRDYAVAVTKILPWTVQDTPPTDTKSNDEDVGSFVEKFRCLCRKRTLSDYESAKAFYSKTAFVLEDSAARKVCETLLCEYGLLFEQDFDLLTDSVEHSWREVAENRAYYATLTNKKERHQAIACRILMRRYNLRKGSRLAKAL